MLFKLLIVAAFFNGLSWMILIPVWQYPDEQAHFGQVQNIAETGKSIFGLNTSKEIVISEEILGTERDDLGNNSYTYHPNYKPVNSGTLIGNGELMLDEIPKSDRIQYTQSEATYNPPFYYLIASRFYKLASQENIFYRVHIVRVMSLITFILNILIINKIGKLLFKGSNVQSRSYIGILAFLPMFVFASTGVLPDPLTNFLFSIIIFCSLKIIITRKILFYTTISIPIVILGLLTRQHFLLSIPIIVVSIILTIKRKYLLLISPAVLLLLLLVTASSINPNFIPLVHILRIPDWKIISLNSLEINSFINHAIWFTKNTISQTWPWYWGVYKWLSYTIPPFYYQVINRLTILSAIGFLLYIATLLKKRKITKLYRPLMFAIVVNLIFFGLFLTWDYFFRARNGYSFGYQGRYFFPLISTQLYIICFGIFYITEHLLNRYKSFILVGLSVIVIIFNDMTLLHVSDKYYDFSSIHSFVITASQYKPDIFKGNIILAIIFLSVIFQFIYLIYFIKSSKIPNINPKSYP